jgi:UDP-glucose 4-epimerase
VILVTGGAGFVGSHLVDKLIDLGYHVRVIDDESATENKKFYWNPKAENYKLDILDYESTRKLYDNVKIVYHFAARSRIQPSVINPGNTLNTNVLGTFNVLKCASEAGVDRLIFSSSSSVYGNNPPPNIETQSPDCLTVYSASKLVGENLCFSFNMMSKIKTLSLRFFNVYGDRQPTVGEYATVIGKFIEQKNAGNPLTIVGDGEQLRSFTNISDIVEACLLAGMLDVEGHNFGKSYNVGFEKEYKIKDIAGMISDNYIHIPKRVGESNATIADSSRFKHVFGWKPTVYLEDWIRNNV